MCVCVYILKTVALNCNLNNCYISQYKCFFFLLDFDYTNAALVNLTNYIYVYTHTIRYTLLVPGWTTLCPQNCLNSSWHRFNKGLDTFLRDLDPY